MRLLKHFPFRFRLGLAAGSVEPDQSTIVATRLQRVMTELTAGYALTLGRVEISPYLGGAVFFDNQRDSVLRIDAETMCTNPPCLVNGKVVRSNHFHFRVLPMAGVSLDFAGLTLSYAYQLALGMTIGSQHRILVGATF
jgi:hypothetical protein